MKMKTARDFEPEERGDSIRRKMTAALLDAPLSARGLSAEIGISEKEVYEHLEHIGKTLRRSGRRLAVTAARCKKCDFVFSKRERLKKPGKCPVCRGESIRESLFSIEMPDTVR